ncbi:glycosyltransferase family 2 protein [Acidisphaera sp. S103]|uniref:glycosyltransferase family 2 protein n=1 Tax=Acidisphaera sp. S103 TaxID=1747223 RepID=UPI00131CE02D|nr:glycosyltransferase family 2 protein [Acidisphaera sp. S103]
MSTPLLSYIVLSYNYEEYIGITINSILSQTHQDFEIVVVDDASRDNSVDVVRSFDDPRIRLFVHEENRGACIALAWALREARGEWIVNLDADDWIAPEKAERQLARAKTTGADIIGTWVRFVDERGQPHPRAVELEEAANQPHQFDLVESWIGRNILCRSSTMVRRAMIERIGTPELTMVRAPDYEHWVRALAAGFRFDMVEEPLTYYRLQPRGVTFGDPMGTLLEMCWAKARNLVPLAERRGLNEDISAMLRWLVESDQRLELTPTQSLRLIGALTLGPNCADYAAWRDMILGPTPEPIYERAGRSMLNLIIGSGQLSLVAKLLTDCHAYIEARDWWKAQSDMWEANALALKDRVHQQSIDSGRRRSWHQYFRKGASLC